MKPKIFLLGLVLVLALSLAACLAPANDISHEFTCDDFDEYANLTWTVSGAGVGDTVTAKVCSNPSTGFAWELAGIDDTDVLKLDGEAEYVALGEAVPGAAGMETWNFTALKEGTTRLLLEYSRPWEGGEKAVRTLEITVTVEQ